MSIRIFQIPVRVAHSHGSHSETGFSGVIRNILKIPLKKAANYYVACGTDAAEWLFGEKLYKQGLVKVFHNVIDSTEFAYNEDTRVLLRQQLGISKNYVVIGCTSRFCYPKNLVFAVDILKELLIIDNHILLLLVGDGVQKAEIVSRIVEYGLEDRVVLTGIVSNVAEMLQVMDFFLMPSFFEGLPVSLIEAQASGLICVASAGIPSESNVTGRVTFVPLEAGAKKWAEIIWRQRGYVRKSQTKELRDAGYDAETSAKELQKFYLDIYERSTDVIL